MVLSIQTLCCDHSYYLTQVLSIFFWLSLRMVLHLHLSPAVFDYTDWTWLGKPHTCLYKTLQLTSACQSKWESLGQKELAWRAQRPELWQRHRSGQGYNFVFAALKVPKSTVPPNP